MRTSFALSVLIYILLGFGVVCATMAVVSPQPTMPYTAMGAASLIFAFLLRGRRQSEWEKEERARQAEGVESRKAKPHEVKEALSVTALIFGAAAIVAFAAAIIYSLEAQPEPAIWCASISGAHTLVFAALFTLGYVLSK